jgi:hypothetical protein
VTIPGETIGVSPTVSFARKVRVFALTIPCLLPLLSGCDLESYPSELTYPLRSDPLVVTPPKSTAWDTIAPGQLDKHIARLRELGGETRDPAKLPANQRQQLAQELLKVFGTPAAPKVELKDGGKEFEDGIKALKLDEKTLAEGSKQYRRHCMHCHGVSGDGRGPTAPWVSPTPRDYRQGDFKFLSADVSLGDIKRKPRRSDLLRTLDHGIEGTSMPSFSLLPEDHKQQLISYVIHLSLRGEVEYRTMMPLLAEGSLGDATVQEKVEEVLKDKLQAWQESNEKGIEPTPYPYPDAPSGSEEARKEWLEKVYYPSVSRGYRLFADKRAGGCIECHSDFGRQVPFRYDSWGTLVRPANLTAGVYRGGRRPIDLYWRIRGGIIPSQMPKSDYTEKTPDKWGKKLGEDKYEFDPYWDLVNFLQALPHPQMLPSDVKDEIYSTRKKETERAQR